MAAGVAALPAALGCGSSLGLGYLTQAAEGQLELSTKGRRIPEVVDDPRVEPKTRALLAEIDDIKRFGEKKGLRPTASYADYSFIGRPQVVWVVSASSPVAFRPRTWSFPLVGSFTYVGWFDRPRADRHADELRAEGYDVDVRASSAYSTLGWFRDPVLSTMLTEGDEAAGNLVDTVLHESVHATYYINSQSYLNESLASFVADKLAAEYLAQTRGTDAREYRLFLRYRVDGARRVKRYHEAYEALDALYKSKQSREEKLAEKAVILRALERQLRLTRPMNNATLIQYRTYGAGGEELEALLSACSGSWPRFWAAMHKLKPEAFTKPQQEDIGPALTPIIAAGCPAAPAAP